MLWVLNKAITISNTTHVFMKKLEKVLIWITLRKHTYSNILQILSPKNENFQIKNPDIFHVSAQNIDCGYSLELP